MEVIVCSAFARCCHASSRQWGALAVDANDGDMNDTSSEPGAATSFASMCMTRSSRICILQECDVPTDEDVGCSKHHSWLQRLIQVAWPSESLRFYNELSLRSDIISH